MVKKTKINLAAQNPISGINCYMEQRILGIYNVWGQWEDFQRVIADIWTS